MAEKDKFDYLKDTDFGRFLEYGDFLGEDSIYNPYNIGTAFYDLGAVPINKLSEIFTGYNPGLSGNRLFNRGDPNEAYFLGATTDATPGFLNYEERMELAKEKAKYDEERAKIREEYIQKQNTNKKPKTNFSINPNLDKFIDQQSIMEKFEDPNYVPADPFEIAAKEAFNPARLQRGNMKLQKAIFDDKMKRGSKQLKDIADKKTSDAAKAKAKADEYASKSFLEKMFDKDVREGELLSNKDKTFATMRAIGDRLLRPANPGESKSLMSDIALGLGDGQDKIAALEDKEYNKQVTKSAADLEKLMTNAELLDIASKIEDRQMRGISDAQLTASQIAKNIRDASLVDPNSPQAKDLLTNDIRNAMAIVAGQDLQPGSAGYQKAIAAELLKNFDLDQKTALLESLDTEYIMMQDQASQEYLKNLKQQLIRELAGAGSGEQSDDVPYLGLVNKK